MSEITMSILGELCKSLPVEQAVLVRGGHGIGKSALAKTLGEVFEIPVIDLRLSQMTEGDFLGLPKLYDAEYDESGALVKHGRTEFMPPDWFVTACTVPVVLLLDEINRATPELMQCGFQLIYDRMIQGKSLHPGTRIIACVNASHHYQVNEMDPALLNRFWTCDLVPTFSDWKEWAISTKLDWSIIEFCEQNQMHWWHNPKQGALEPGKIYPTPRGWDMLNRALKQPRGNGHTAFDELNSPIFRHLCAGLVGDEAGSSYHAFVKNYDRQISAKMILDEYKTVKKRVVDGLSVESIGTVIDKIVVACEDALWTKSQAKNVSSFMTDIKNNELAFALWTRISSIRKNDIASKNMRLLHREAREVIMAAMGAYSNAGSNPQK
jgi:hypothetical protein